MALSFGRDVSSPIASGSRAFAEVSFQAKCSVLIKHGNATKDIERAIAVLLLACKSVHPIGF